MACHAVKREAVMSIVVAEVGAAERSVAVEIIGLSGRYSAEPAAEREEVQGP